jgi:hypothetical protein
VNTNIYNMKNNNNNIKFSEQLGKVTDVKKLLKQIDNLKANVKKKTHQSITGNKTKKQCGRKNNVRSNAGRSRGTKPRTAQTDWYKF